MPSLTLLPLDLKGTLSSNRITREVRTLVRVDNQPHRVLIPKFGAFYNDESLVVLDGTKRLVHGKDYTTTYLYRDLSMLTSKPAYAFIVIINAAVSNTLTISYAAVGGNYGVNVDELAALIASFDSSNYRVNYEDIIDKPKAFNPLPHMDEYWQLYGAENTVTVLERLRSVLDSRDSGVVQELRDYASAYYQQAVQRMAGEDDVLTAHVNDFNRPHAETKEALGLSLMNNWRMARAADGLDSTLDMYYATPEAGAAAMNKVLGDALRAHTTRRDNPHQIRAQDVGVYTTVEINTRLEKYLPVDGIANNSSLIFGYDIAGWKTYSTANLNGSSVTSGLFPTSMMGQAGGDSTKALMGDGSWKDWIDLIKQTDKLFDRKAVVYVRLANARYTTTFAINYLNANYSNLAQYPVGTKAVFTGRRNTQGITQWTMSEAKFLIRTAAGWEAWIV